MKTVVVQISAKQGGGKTTLCNELLQVNLASKFYAAFKFSYAEPLYEMHNAIQDIWHKYGYEKVKKDGALLQYLGTDYGRKTRGESVWVDIMRHRIRSMMLHKSNSVLHSCELLLILIDDCRFRNEFHAFDEWKDVKTINIRLYAPKEVRKTRVNCWRDNDTHPSEVDLDEYESQGKFAMMFDTSVNSAVAISQHVLREVYA